jgi:hypothetical protein
VRTRRWVVAERSRFTFTTSRRGVQVPKRRRKEKRRSARLGQCSGMSLEPSTFASRRVWRDDWRNAVRSSTILGGKVLLSIRAVIAIAFAASVVAAANAADATPIHVVDKTFICSTSTVGGAHAFWVNPWGVGSPPGTQNAIVGVFFKYGQLVYAHDRCEMTTIRVPLSHGALPGPSPFINRYGCVLPGRILVHVRATVNLQHLDRSQLAVRLERRSVPIAYATSKATGKQDSSGNERYVIRLWVSNHCDRLNS